jgi:hypothetical protein
LAAHIVFLFVHLRVLGLIDRPEDQFKCPCLHEEEQDSRLLILVVFCWPNNDIIQLGTTGKLTMLFWWSLILLEHMWTCNVCVATYIRSLLWVKIPVLLTYGLCHWLGTAWAFEQKFVYTQKAVPIVTSSAFCFGNSCSLFAHNVSFYEP